MQEIKINTPSITLGQLLKLSNEFPSGGFIKHYLNETGVYVNERLEHKRGKKLYHNDLVMFNDKCFIVKQTNNV